jgi:cysteine synthase
MSSSPLLQLIGNTPLVKLTRIDTGPCELWLKLENQNPGGSIKDRIAVVMIEAAERDGRLQPGGTLIEATAGNTGLALALVGALKGYRTLLVIPDKMSAEKISHLRALGAEVVITRSNVGKGNPDYYQDKAAAIAARTPTASISISLRTRPIRSRTSEPPDRRSCSRCRAGWMPWCAAWAAAARAAAAPRATASPTCRPWMRTRCRLPSSRTPA